MSSTYYVTFASNLYKSNTRSVRNNRSELRSNHHIISHCKSCVRERVAGEYSSHAFRLVWHPWHQFSCQNSESVHVRHRCMFLAVAPSCMRIRSVSVCRGQRNCILGESAVMSLIPRYCCSELLPAATSSSDGESLICPSTMLVYAESSVPANGILQFTSRPCPML